MLAAVLLAVFYVACAPHSGLLREAERQFRSSIRVQPTVSSYLELCNVFMRMDQPNSALDLLAEAA
jgi:tetratricopeptide repeat protein 8